MELSKNSQWNERWDERWDNRRFPRLPRVCRKRVWFFRISGPTDQWQRAGYALLSYSDPRARSGGHREVGSMGHIACSIGFEKKARLEWELSASGKGRGEDGKVQLKHPTSPVSYPFLSFCSVRRKLHLCRLICQLVNLPFYTDTHHSFWVLLPPLDNCNF